MDQLLKTPLHSWHAAHNGRMVDFAGWSMPVQYSSIIEEHQQTRNSVGIFDVSHMGRLYFSGQGVEDFLDGLTTRRIAGVPCKKVRYSLITNSEGGILDDVLVYHVPDLTGNPFYMMVVNASNRQKIVSWIESHLGDSGIGLDDRTDSTAMIAVQGPKANSVVAKLADMNPEDLGYYEGATSKIGNDEVLISRTGYTGEDGCEIICNADAAESIWQKVFDLSQPLGGGVSGLAARNSLRLEAGMPLYGHELSESLNPAQTDLKFAIQMKDREFVGKHSILAARNDDQLPVRIGLVLEGKRAAREGCSILKDEKVVGEITSGAFGPTLEKSISMGYIHPEHAAVDTEVTIDIRGKQHSAKVTGLPFYQREKA
ncbi:MAG: glycine cleavage system aminomethyltransferase GcvT [Planctomycetota bacterium]